MPRLYTVKNIIFSSSLVGCMMLSMPASSASRGVTPEANDDSEILVIGETQRKNRVSNFIKTIVKPSREGQYASFQGRICPVAMGLPDEHVNVIEARMIEVAKAANIKTGKPGCAANMAVVIVHDTKDFFAELRKKSPEILSGISIPERNLLMNAPGPAYAWQTITARGANGSSDSGAGTALVGGKDITTGDLSSGLRSGNGSRTSRGSNSRINRSVRFDINLAVVLIEKSALENVTLRQVGDYSLMRLLGHTQDVKFEDINERTVLSLFTDRADDMNPPESVTAWDMAFMKSMYKAKGAKSAARQRNAMAKVFDKELVKWAQEK